ncbi:DUF4148 domain-containing protein [Paucibacter sp. PLA-PC-4]|uniref:DUF4148 domain-containing protein n=1 Tax=Paucibacter sp. PLA-PC-4 TaxID=2993655 RepID=UPI0022490A56|nr:DUF4148 domain-containing protein [Paucibacter sp. PLA-PC-4]MCX2862551.1 DUF4148 domain-containing protein [Paucibacter sp. PLA-PC-4]
MNKLTLIALSTLLSAGAAMADGLSRDEVVAELVRARNAGELTALQSESYGYSGYGGYGQAAATSSLSREAVIADLRRAQQSGELARRDAESYGPSVAPIASSKTRTQVLAELQAARDSGELALLNSNNPGYAELLQLGKRTGANDLMAGQPGIAR